MNKNNQVSTKIKQKKQYRFRLCGRSRSKWKGVYSKIRYTVFEKMRQIHHEKGLRKSIFRFKPGRHNFTVSRLTRSRASVILPQHIRLEKVFIYNGKISTLVPLTADTVGHRLGEFNRTTRRGSNIHRNNAKTKKNKSKK